MTDGTVAGTFVGSDGNYYTAAEVTRRLADDDWRFCMRETTSGKELFETDRGELLLLVPADEADLGAGWRERTRRR